MKRLFTNGYYWAGLGTAAVLALILPLILIPSGFIDTSALPEPGWMEAHVGPWAMNASRRHRAPSTANPYKQDPQVMAEALSHYRSNCLPCHGASGAKAAEFAEGFHPPAPHLTLPRIQELTDGQLFWTVRNGIMMTGMPAFANTHSDDEIWKIVAFVRHLPNLSDEEREALKQGQEMDHHHDGSHGSPPAGAEGDHAGHQHEHERGDAAADAANDSVEQKAPSTPHVHVDDTTAPADAKPATPAGDPAEHHDHAAP